MAYATLAQVKAALTLDSTDTVDDSQITMALTAAEAMVNGYCERTFTVAGTASARVYATSVDYLVFTDDATTVTLVESDPNLDGTWVTSWAATDWQAEPLNGTVAGQTVPYTQLRAVGNYAFPPSHRAAVRVTATWGWAAVPNAVTQATIQTAIRLWKRLDTPLGFGGGPDTGLLYVSRKIDGDVAQLLAPYRKGIAQVGGIA